MTGRALQRRGSPGAATPTAETVNVDDGKSRQLLII